MGLIKLYSSSSVCILNFFIYYVYSLINCYIISMSICVYSLNAYYKNIF